MPNNQSIQSHCFKKNTLALETFSNYIRLCKYSIPIPGRPMQQLAKAFKALSDESRLRIINLLLHSGELCVCDIEAILGCTQTKVSRHLNYLKKGGLVEGRQQGLWMLYSIPKPKNEDHKALLECVKTIVTTNPIALKDMKQLNKNINKGCCATFSILKPNQVPVTLQLN